jgi:hypothetical protein
VYVIRLPLTSHLIFNLYYILPLPIKEELPLNLYLLSLSRIIC